MSAIRFESNLTDALERELIRREMDGRPLRLVGVPRSGRASGANGATRFANALVMLKGTLIVGAIVYVTITLALQATARFF